MQIKDSASPIFIEYDRHNPDHKKSFGDLNREWLSKYFYVEPQDEAAFGDPETHVLDKGGILLFAEVDGMIVGTGSLLCLPDGSYEIAKMAVTETYQGRGIGEKMLLELIFRAEARGAKKLFIVSNTLLSPAIRLYRRHGFRYSGEIRHAHYARGNITLERRTP